VNDVVILDLGYGNTRSVALAFERLGANPTLSSDASAVEQATRVVLPGVGAAGVAMERLQRCGLGEILRNRTRPTLGICLGMQLMFEESEEDRGTALLGVLPGAVTALRPVAGFPVPHMGWSKIKTDTPDIGLAPGDHVYFAHGFACPHGPATIASATYGEFSIPAVIRSGAWWGAQFHPERSSAAGSRFLTAFLQS
jgi:imidazole glycerol-phosphate synthase subunit HisH